MAHDDLPWLKDAALGDKWGHVDPRWDTACALCGKPATQHIWNAWGWCRDADKTAIEYADPDPYFTLTVTAPPPPIKNPCGSCGHGWDDHTGDPQNADVLDTRCTYPNGQAYEIGLVAYTHCKCERYTHG